MTWKKAATIAELEHKPVLFKSRPRQIAVFKVDGQVFAIDNRCPHEGYPLVEGTVDENCLLTCNWHNWKFRLQDGRCVLGGDHVRTYPVEQRNGDVWVNLADPPPEEIQADILDGLHTAFLERDYGRICREITRLHYNRLDPLVAVRKAVEWSHDRFEFGYTHAYAATADWLHLAETKQEGWEQTLICLAEAVDHISFDALRHKQFPHAEPGEPFEDSRFAAAVENEQRELAEGMVRRGLDDGLHWSDMEQSFAEAALAHYNDFGHSLIYVSKLGQFIDRAGRELETFLVPSLARSLCYTTREDLLPEFKDYGRALAEIGSPSASDHTPLNAGDLFPITTRRACEWVVENFSTHRPESMYDALLELAARNLLHYDLSYQAAYDRPVSENVGWLDFTHGITFGNAVRDLCTRYPALWRPALLQMACFAGRNYRFLDRDIGEDEWMVDDAQAFFAELQTRILDHGLRDPIYSAHLLKTTLAVDEEALSASDSCRRYLLAGLNRFVNSPLKQKHAHRLARQAIALVKRDFE